MKGTAATTPLVLTAAMALGACSSSRGHSSLELGPRTRSSAALVQFESCDALLARLRADYAEQMRATVIAYADSWSRYDIGPGGPADEAMPAAPGADSGARQEGVDYSGTNNQEAGVDEADFLKTDGYYIYVLSGHSLAILGVPEVGTLTNVSTTDIEGWPTQLLVAGDRVAVFSSVYTWDLPATDPLAAWVARAVDGQTSPWYRVPSLVKATILDVSDRASPRLLREVYLEGSYQTGRKIDTTVRMLSYASIDVPGVRTWVELPPEYWQIDESARAAMLDEAIRRTVDANDAVIGAATLDDFVPLLLVREAGGQLRSVPLGSDGCGNFAVPEDGTGRGFTSILTLGLFADELGVEADHVVTNWSTAYASLDTLVIAEAANDPWWFWGNVEYEEATNLHRFDISTPGVTTYTGSGRVDGLVDTPFSMSEQDGKIRVATTTGWWNRWWEPVEERPAPESHVYVLDGQGSLKVVGHVGGIGVGERLWATRFVGDQAFLVSFRSIDPLWTVDLSDPASPRLAGELEVPGVSTYIHPLEGGHLLTIGYGATDQSELAWGSTAISLFDVGDFSQPKLDSALTLGPPSSGWTTYSDSAALWEHKAFQYWAPLGLLAVPLSSWRSYQYPCPEDPGWYCYGYQYRTSLELTSVDAAAGTLASYGTLDQSTLYNQDPGVWWYAPGIQRSIFMHDDAAGDFVYAVSDHAVSVHRIASGLPMVGSVLLPGTPDYHYGYVY